MEMVGADGSVLAAKSSRTRFGWRSICEEQPEAVLMAAHLLRAAGGGFGGGALAKQPEEGLVAAPAAAHLLREAGGGFGCAALATSSQRRGWWWLTC